MTWKVVLWVIIDVKSLHRFGILPTWLVIIQFKPHITIMIIIKMSYELTLESF